MATRKTEPLVFEWEDRIEGMEELNSGALRPAIQFNWGALKFEDKEAQKIRRLRPFYGDKVKIRVEFLRGRLREAHEEAGE